MAFPIVGRTHELVELDGVLDNVEAGLGGVVFLVGEAGIGKTRLAEEVARRATARGFAVTWGRAWEGGGTPAFWPWARALRGLGEGAPELDRSVTSRVPLERFELYDTVSQFLIDRSAARPVAIVLEDLHAADRSSLALLGFVAAQLRGSRVLLVGTYRVAEARLLADAGADIARAGRDGRVIPLGGLRSPEIVELARAFGVDDEGVACRVHGATDGNPFFAGEILRALRARPSSTLPIPESVRAAVRERVALITPQTRAILEAAAATGRDLDEALLAATAAPSSEVAAALAEAVRAGLVVDDPPGRGRFAHALVRDTIHDDLPAERRFELHRRVAVALTDRGTPDDALAGEIAHHYLEAGAESLGDAVRYSCLAAERSLRQLAFEDAGAVIDRALTAAAHADPAIRAELLLLACATRLKLGDDAGGRQASDEVAAIARRQPSPELLARAALAYGSVIRPARVDPLLVGMLEEALGGLATSGGPLRALVEARLAGALQPAFDPGVPIAKARAAIASARGLDSGRRGWRCW